MVTGIPATTTWKGARLALFRARTLSIAPRPAEEAATQETAKTAKDETKEPAAAPAGTIIGRTRLMGGHGQSPEGGGAQGAAPTMKMGQPQDAIHPAARMSRSDPVAGWVVVVKGPGQGNFCPVFVGMNSRRPRCQPACQPELRRRFHLARGARLHHLRRGAALLLPAARRQVEPRAPGRAPGAQSHRAQAERSHPHRPHDVAVRAVLRPRFFVD